jgi:hypothetical protein
MWDIIRFLVLPFLCCAGQILEFLHEDNRPEARRITTGCALVVGVVALASVVLAYLVTMR